MAGMSAAEAGRSGRRSVDATVNLVPFIDLLSGLITFLLITAVWIQVGALPAATAGAGQGTPPPPPLEVAVSSGSAWIGSGATGHAVSVQDAAALEQALKEARAAWPTPEARVRADDDVTYDLVVRVTDACRGAGFTGVTLEGHAD